MQKLRADFCLSVLLLLTRHIDSYIPYANHMFTTTQVYVLFCAGKLKNHPMTHEAYTEAVLRITYILQYATV